MWKAILSDDSEIKETGDISQWRDLRYHCKKNNLKIKSLLFNDKEVDWKAKAYFIIYQITAFMKTKFSIQLQGIGVLKNNKAYVNWYTLPDKTKAYREVYSTTQPYNELAIERNEMQ